MAKNGPTRGFKITRQMVPHPLAAAELDAAEQLFARWVPRLLAAKDDRTSRLIRPVPDAQDSGDQKKGDREYDSKPGGQNH